MEIGLGSEGSMKDPTFWGIPISELRARERNHLEDDALDAIFPLKPRKDPPHVFHIGPSAEKLLREMASLYTSGPEQVGRPSPS